MFNPFFALSVYNRNTVVKSLGLYMQERILILPLSTSDFYKKEDFCAEKRVKEPDSQPKRTTTKTY